MQCTAAQKPRRSVPGRFEIIGMNARSKRKAATWLWMRWSTTKEFVLYAAVNGLTVDPVRKSTWDEAVQVLSIQPIVFPILGSFDGVFSGLIVLDDAVSAAETGEDDIDVGIAENGITRCLGDLRFRLRPDFVEIRQGLIFHVENRMPLILRRRTLGCCATYQKYGKYQSKHNVFPNPHYFSFPAHFSPQISQITQITMNVCWRLRKLPGLNPRGLPTGSSFRRRISLNPEIDDGRSAFFGISARILKFAGAKFGGPRMEDMNKV
jgi:hypothetical protein